MFDRSSRHSSFDSPRIPVIFMPEGSSEHPDIQSLGVDSLHLPGVLVPEGGSPPGYPYIVVGDLHRDDDDDESEECLPDEFHSDQEFAVNAGSIGGVVTSGPKSLAEQDDQSVAATAGATLAPIGLDSMQGHGSRPPEPSRANSIDVTGLTASTAEAMARAAALATAPLDVSGIADWPAVADWPGTAPTLEARGASAAGWDGARRPVETAPSTTDEQPWVDEASTPSFPTEHGVEVALPDGRSVPDDRAMSGHLMAPVADLSPVAAAGREAGETYRGLLKDPDTAAGALPHLATSMLINVGHGGRFNYQRRGNHTTGVVQLPQYRGVSNFNVGLFCQQAGLSRDETLTAAGRFSRIFSRDAKPDRPYRVDSRNTEFINVGYDAGRSGLFGPPPQKK